MATERVHYKWKPRSGLDHLDPNQVGAHLEALDQGTGGYLKPSVLVEDAQRPDSPIHSAFEWNDETAAHRYRLGQAAHLMRSHVQVHVLPSGEETTTRVYVNVMDSTERGRAERVYIRTATVLSDEDLRVQLLGQALEDLRRFQRRYEHLKELADVYEAIEDFRERLGDEGEEGETGEEEG